MFANLLLVVVCVGFAVYGAWETAHTRHRLTTHNKRRHTDH